MSGVGVQVARGHRRGNRRFRALLAGLPTGPRSGTPGDPGLFGPSSLAWRVGRERILLAGGGAALLLQVSHPLVAAGVLDHSDFTADPLQRLHGTLDATLTVTFGDTAQAHAAAAAVGRRHRPVSGVLPTAVAKWPAGASYRADDPDLALWVFTTLVWSAIVVREGFVARLSRAEQDRYYDELKRFGLLFGVTEDVMPRSYADLTCYFRHVVDNEVVVGPAARELAIQILAPEDAVLPRSMQWLPTVLAGALLPPSIRSAYRLPWGRRERFLYHAVRMATRTAIRIAPASIRYWPHYRTALERLSQIEDGHVSESSAAGTRRLSWRLIGVDPSRGMEQDDDGTRVAAAVAQRAGRRDRHRLTGQRGGVPPRPERRSRPGPGRRGAR